jgi:histidinol-phosphate aminotransferase
MRKDREDLAALLDSARRERAKLIYVSNPNSPMGTWWPADEIARMIAELPDETMLVLDEAYVDTAPVGTAPALDVTAENVIRYRTFSKAYGIAGARIGYAVACSEVVTTFDKVRNHYGINRVGQIGALEAIRDQAYLTTAVGAIARARRRLEEIATGNGLTAISSGASFVAMDCSRDGAFAKAVLDELLARDVFVRKPVAAGIDRCIRVSCSVDDDLDVFAAELPHALQAARAAL